ncbi:MAG: hypothetical protein ILNGONEN_01571 [Syntrophorhabdaceae bacterium]|nr:hypothetical protein [Syntrophorhabdaceae bacterium]
MPARVIGKDSKVAKDSIRGIHPSIIIGLGGTGKEILLRMRRRFFEKMGIVGFPAMRYLWVDTDVQYHDIDGRPLDYVAKEIQFTNDETINIEVLPTDFTSIFSRPKANEHIFQWIDPALKDFDSVRNGARQIRMMGRLGFFHHAYTNNNICSHLNKAKAAVFSNEVRIQMLDEYAIELDKVLQVIIVCSLAGGTGSGTFLDTAFMVRDEFSAFNPNIIGYLMLPPVFSPDLHNAEVIYANSYAALKELEYYSGRKDILGTPNRDHDINNTVSAHDFVVEWKVGSPRAIQGPPFNTCYLINNETEKGGSIGPEHKTHLCDMIAENLMLDYISQPFSAKKRSIRFTLNDYLTNELEYEYKDEKGFIIHTDIFTFRFSAFGLSKIFVPIEHIYKACAFKLGSDLLSFMVQKNVTGKEEPQDVIRSTVLPELRLLENGDANNICSDLMIANDKGQNILAIIKDVMLNSERAAFRKKLQTKQIDLVKDFDHRILAYKETWLDKSIEGEKLGAFTKRLYDTNKIKFLEKAKEYILTLIRTWMNAPQHRAKVTLEYLRTLNQALKEQGNYFQRQVKVTEKTSEEAFALFQQYQKIMADEIQGLWLGRWTVNGIVDSWLQRLTVNELIDLLCQAANDYLTHSSLVKVYQVAQECCHELRDYISERVLIERSEQKKVMGFKGVIQQVKSIQDDLVGLRLELEAELQLIENIKSSQHLIFQNLYYPGMFKQYYKLQKEGKTLEIQHDELHRLEILLLEHLGVASIFDFKQIRPDILRQELMRLCLEQFQHLKFEIDAIQTLYESHQNNQTGLNAALNLFARNGRVWLKKNPLAHSVPAITQNYMEELDLGLNQKNTKHIYYQDFEEQVINVIKSDSLKGPLNSKLDVEPDTVYLYNEIAGIPIMYIDRIDEYRRAYSNYIATHKHAPHIDRNSNKFHDVLVKSEEEVREMIRINTALLVGAILRIIDINVKSEDANVMYRYQDRTQFPPTPVPLGNKYVAVETLRYDHDLLIAIERDIQRIRRRLESDIHAQLEFFTTLSYHTLGDEVKAEGIYTGPFPPKYVKIGNAHILKLEPEHRALANIIRTEKERLKKILRADDSRIQDMFIKMYRDIDNFTEERIVDGKVLRILKKNVLEPKENA